MKDFLPASCPPAILLLLLLPGSLQAAPDPAPMAASALESCLLEALRSAPDSTPIGALRTACRAQSGGAEAGAADESAQVPGSASAGAPRDHESLVIQRMQREELAEGVRSLLTPHKRNYLLPATYSISPNEEPFTTAQGELLPLDQVDHWEAKFQLSLKFSLANNLLLPNDTLFFAFTSQSYWQAYNREISAPFRETNYEPEVFWRAPLPFLPFGIDANVMTFGFSHQSNGRGGTLSRSWNRLYSSFTWEKNNFVFNLKPWWRIPEDEKENAFDPSGDDNPDIEKYMGNFEFTTTYRRDDHEFSMMLRNNLRSDSKGAVQLEWTFPLLGRVRGYAQYFNGYGESLIDYNARIERIGVGILLSDLL